MANTKEIQRRIKSVNNTKKITKAMEMVSAAKMRRAVEAVLRTRTYANLSWTTVLNIVNSVGGRTSLHPMLSVGKVKKDKIKKVGIVAIASNRGLCGGFNTAIINKVHESINKHHKKENIEAEIIVVGKKALGLYSRHGYKIVAEFPKLDIASEISEIAPIAKMVVEGFLNKEYEKIMVAYTDYISASKQEPRVKQLLPVDINTEDDYLGVVGKDSRIGLDKNYVKDKEEKYLRDKGDSYLFTFEPTAEEVLDEMIPRLVEVQLYQALLESNASEHSARMTAMHQANEAAGDLVKELTLYYNKARQAAITAEIAEISAGANALAE